MEFAVVVTSLFHRRLFCSGILASALVASGCAGGSDPGVPTPELATMRTAAGVVGKPLRLSATGLAVADELVVSFQPGVAPERVAALAADLGAELTWRGRAIGVAVLRFADAGSADQARAVLAAHPDVDEVVPNRVAVGSGKSGGTGISTSPGPEPSALQWNLAALRVGTAGTLGTGEGVRIALLDTGVAFEDHADGSGVYRLAPTLAGAAFVAGYDFINDDDHPNDDQGHGTHLAGVIVAQRGIVGVAPAVELMPVKVLDADNLGTELALAEGIVYAVDHGADIINMSLSFAPSFFPSRYLQAAVDYATERGVVLIAAAGNHGAQVVTYPAAFRDVIAVGSSELNGGGFWWWLADPWSLADLRQRLSSYSNRGWLVDVVAPGGVIDRDVSGDGHPEAILAESFGTDPTQFGYYYYAGTSQAAAQVSGLAALMVAANRSLDVHDLRAVLGESASFHGVIMSDSVGRGFARADIAVAGAKAPGAAVDRPRYFAAIDLGLHTSGKQRRGRAVVEILDESGTPQPLMVVYGSFTGGSYASTFGITDSRGRVTFWSPKSDARLLAFQVDAVTQLGSTRAFDRPRGAISTDSCSVELLSAYATGQGISTSPGPIPVALRPPVVSGQIPTVTLLNYAWSLASVPLAVAVDESWFAEALAEDYAVAFSEGSGISTSPVRIDPTTSFPSPVKLLAYDEGAPTECVPVVVRTFLGTTPGAAAPIIPDPDCPDPATCAAQAETLANMWGYYSGQGISTSPIWEPDSGLSQTAFDHLTKMMQLYVTFGFGTTAAPVGNYNAVLEAAGLGLTPLPETTNSSAGSVPLP